MNYEEKYKEALEKALDLYNQGLINPPLEHIFPELKESKDEKIKREIVAYINELADLKNEKIPTKWLAWLKKQGKQTQLDYEHADILQKDFATIELKKLDADKWISVEDKLPMEFEPVLAAFGSHYARVCFYGGGKWYIDTGVLSEEVFGVSHWMQIPPPPKKRGEE